MSSPRLTGAVDESRRHAHRRAALPGKAWRRLREAKVHRRWVFFVFLFAAAIMVLDLLWLQRFQSGGPLTIDESGYLAIAGADADALRGDGPWGLAREFVGQHYQAPFVPLVAGLLELIFGRSTDVGFAVLPLSAFVVVMATYGVARRLVSPPWAALAAIVSGSVPRMFEYSRFFEFAVPTTAVMMLTLLALLRSQALSHRGWSIAAGILTGLLLLTRTMTIAFLPGLLGAAALQVAVHRRPRAVTNLAIASVAGVLTAAVWYGRNLRYVGHYLLHFGYGSEAGDFGSSHSPFSWAFWSKEARVMLGSLNVPLAALVLFGLVCGTIAVVVSWRQRFLILLLRSEVALLILVVAEGYLVLSSTRNVGAGFELPLLPILVILGTVGVSRLTHRVPSGGRVLAAGFGAATIAASLLAVVGASGRIDALASNRTIRVPGFGTQPVISGEGRLFTELKESGYPVGRATDTLPPALKSWDSRMRGLATIVIEAARRQGVETPVVGAPPDLFYSANGITLAARMARHERIAAADIFVPSNLVSKSAYTAELNRLGATFLMIPSPSLYRSYVQLDALNAAALSAGYRVLRRVSQPDAVVSIWSRAAQA